MLAGASQMATAFDPVLLDRDDVARIDAAIEAGLIGEAIEAARRLPAPERWAEVEDRLVGSLLLAHGGAPRRSMRMDVETARRSRTHLGAAAMRAEHVLTCRGPLAMLDELGKWRREDAEAPRHWARLLAWRARAAVSLRDFEAADPWIAEAIATDPSLGMTWLVRVARFERDDRPEDALAAAEEAARLLPTHGGSQQVLAHQLANAGRWHDAVERLGAAIEKLELPYACAMLASLQREVGDARSAR